MKRKQTHVRSKSSVTTSALVGAALVASLGAAAAGFASLDTQPSFKVANAGNPTSQPLGMEVTSSTPYSFAEFSAMFDLSSSSPRNLAVLKTLQGGEILQLSYAPKAGTGAVPKELLYLSKTDGFAYRLGQTEKMPEKWLTFAKNKATVKTINDQVLFERIKKYYYDKKQGIRHINLIPGNHIYIFTKPSNPTKQHYLFYGTDKEFYEIPSLKPEVLSKFTKNAPMIASKFGLSQYELKNNGVEYIYNIGFNKAYFIESPIYQVPTDLTELEAFMADKNQAAATAKWGNDLQALVKSFYH